MHYEDNYHGETTFLEDAAPSGVARRSPFSGPGYAREVEDFGMEVRQDPSGVTYVCEIPHAKKERATVEVEGDVFTVHAWTVDENGKVDRRFRRSTKLPPDVSTGYLASEYGGRLHVRFHRREPVGATVKGTLW